MSRDRFSQMADDIVYPNTAEGTRWPLVDYVAAALRTLARDERRAGWIAGQESMRARIDAGWPHQFCDEWAILDEEPTP